MHPVFKLVLLLIILFSLTSPPGIAPAAGETNDPWWDVAWPYRILVEVEGSGTASVNLDFTDLFSELGLPGALLDLRSIRVVPYPNGQPGNPLLYQETYSTPIIDIESFTKEAGDDPYWEEDESTELDLDESRSTISTASIHAHITITEISPQEPGFKYHFNDHPTKDWDGYEVLIYDVWPETNLSAADQTPYLYHFRLEGLQNCPIKYITGPSLVLEQWNPASVSLKPFGNCNNPDLSALEYLRFYVRVRRDHDESGLFEPGDELHLWLDNFRLVDQDGDGEITWDTEPGVSRYYIYFNSLNPETEEPPKDPSHDYYLPLILK